MTLKFVFVPRAKRAKPTITQTSGKVGHLASV